MGYEVTYIYHERVDGKYNTEEKKELKKKIGSPMDETPLEQLAAAVLAQMARRDILVVDVEIKEFTKRNISFKQSNDGNSILIKGKKFGLDQSAALVAQGGLTESFEEESEVSDEAENFSQNFAQVKVTMPVSIDPFKPVVVPGKKPVVAGGNLAPEAPVNKNKVMFWVEYEPNDRQIVVARQKKYRLTQSKRYPVHRATPNDLGGQEIYISDDAGQVLKISEDYFSVVGKGLVGDDEVGFSEPRGVGPKPRLMYEGQMRADPGVPEVRAPRQIPEHLKHIPIDGQDVGIPDQLFAVPVLRPGMDP
jgi:hypothetical protein